MKFIKNILIVLALVMLYTGLDGQVVLQPKEIVDAPKGIIYKKETSFGFRLHENGFAVSFNKGNIPTFYRTNYYSFELGYYRDPREQRQNKNYSLSLFNSSRSYVYGKINSVINLRAAVGMKRYLSEKARRRGLAIGYSLEGGPSIALLKPYYLDLIHIIDDDTRDFEIRTERYTEENAEKFLNENDIYGSSGFFRGFSDISIVPGIQAKASLHFSLGAYDKVVKAVDLGVMADLYIKDVPILVDSEFISNKPYFVKLFLKFEIGKRRI